MNENRRLHCGLVFKDTVYVIGGTNDGTSYKSCEAYNTSKNEWKYIKPMNAERACFTATVIDNKFIYVFGDSAGSDTIERYDFA